MAAAGHTGRNDVTWMGWQLLADVDRAESCWYLARSPGRGGRQVGAAKRPPGAPLRMAARAPLSDLAGLLQLWAQVQLLLRPQRALLLGRQQLQLRVQFQASWRQRVLGDRVVAATDVHKLDRAQGMIRCVVFNRVAVSHQ
jgi:hypothetical protein